MDMNKERYADYLMLLILIAAFIIRVSNIWFGYPFPVHPDEPVLVHAALNIIETGDLNPHNFLYPSLNIYLQALLFNLITPPDSMLTEIPLVMRQSEITFYLYGRLLNVIFSTLTIYFVYEIGRRLFNRGAGLSAVCFITVSSLALENSYYATVDTPTAFWSSLSCLMAVMIYTEGPKRWFYLIGGACVGLAISSKYTAFPAFLPILIAHLYRVPPGKLRFDLNIVLSVLAVPCAFLLTTPYAVLDYRSFMDAVLFQRKTYSIVSHPGSDSMTNTSFLPYFTYLFTEGYGKLPTIFAFAGAAWLFVKDRSKALLITSFTLVLFLFLGSYKVYYPRNILPLIPFLSLLSSYSIVFCSQWFSQVLSRRQESGKLLQRTQTWKFLQRHKFGKTAAFTCGIALLAASIHGQLLIDAKMIRDNTLPDTRWMSFKWIQQSLPPGVAIGREHYTPPLERYSNKHKIVFLDWNGVVSKKEVIPYLDFMVVSSEDYSRFVDYPDRYPAEAMIYDTFFKGNELLKEFIGD